MQQLVELLRDVHGAIRGDAEELPKPLRIGEAEAVRPEQGEHLLLRAALLPVEAQCVLACAWGARPRT